MKILFLLISILLLLNKVQSQYSFNSIQNLGNNIYIYVLGVESSHTKQLFINDYEVTAYCPFQLGSSLNYFKCTDLPIVDQIKSGTFKLVINGITITRDYSLCPVISTVTYIDSTISRLPTTGGYVVLSGRYFDLNKYDGSTNNFQLIYRRQELSLTVYTIHNSSSITVLIPDGTGYTPGRIDNPLYARSATNTTDTPKNIIYEGPKITKNTFDEVSSYFTIDGSNFGAYPNLIKIYACGRVISDGDIQVTVPHYQLLVYYDLAAFNYLSCTNYLLSVNNINSSSSSFAVASHIYSVSTPPSLGGQITIMGSILNNVSATGNTIYWRIYMNGVSYSNTICPFLNGTTAICNSPSRGSNTKLSVYLEINYQKYTETIDAPYLIQQIYSASKLIYGQAGLVTIKGDNFFQGAISVSIGGKECTNPQFIDSSTITCTFSADVTPSTSGLMVSVSTINGVSSESVFQYYSESFSSVTQIGDSLILEGTSFSSSTLVSVGSLDITSYCTVNSSVLISCYNIPSIPSGDVKISGASESTLPFVFTPIITSVSNDMLSTTGEAIEVIGKYFELQVYNQNEPSLLIFMDKTIPITNFVLKSSTEIQLPIPSGTGTGHLLLIKQTYLESNSVSFSYLAPKIISFTQDSTNLLIYGSNFGKDISLISISIGPNVLNAKRIVSANTNLTVTLPWTQQNGQLIVNVNGQQDSIPFKLIPRLISVDSPPVIGGLVDVVGNFMNNKDLDNNDLNVLLNIGEISSACLLVDTPTTSSTNNYKYSCQILEGSGKFNSFISVDGQNSNIINTSYQSPSIISSSSTIYGEAGLITIKGENFATPVSVHIQDSNANDLECTNPSVLSSKEITCQFASTLPPIDNQYFNVIVNVNGLSSSNKVFKYTEEVSIDQVIQNQNSITIVGTGYSNDISSTTIFISTQDLTLECNINNNTHIVCLDLPLYILSGNIVVSNKFTSSNSYQFYFTPYIISLDIPIMDTLGNQIITITGRFFENVNPITNQDNNFKLLSDGVIQLEITQMDGTKIIAKSISGVGKNHYLVVSQNQNMYSNQIQYSYIPPVISNLIQISENQFSIDAQYFSSNDLTLNSIILNDSPNTIRPTVSNDGKSLLFTLNDGKSSNGQIVLNVDGQLSNYLSIYLKPTIKSISLKPYLDGSSVVIVSGLYFSNINYQTNNNINLIFSYILDNDSNGNSNILQCNYINGESVSCKGFNGYGSAKLSLTKIDDSVEFISNSLEFSFQSPIVIKSTSLYYNVPGNITITVESFLSNDLQIYVENVECIAPIVLDNKHIKCYYDASVPPKQDQSSLEISVLSNNMIGKNQVFYYYESLNCPNNCTSNSQGICNPTNGNCICLNNWEGLDCSIEKQEPLPPPEVDDNGDTTLNGGKLNFTVSIVYLREIDINGNQVKVIPMNSINWVNRTKISDTESYYKGTFENDPTIVELDVTFYNNSIDYDFAGDIISIPSNSIKYIITISNYIFSSELNTFQVIYNSKAKKYYNDGCKDIETTSNSGSGLNTTESVSWFQLVSGGSVMDAKFSRRMFIDDKVRKSDVSILSLNDPLYLLLNSTTNNSSSSSDNQDNDEYYNSLTSINTPYFDKSIQLDPSFNSLITTSTNDSSCKDNKWKIPVIASLCSFFGVALVIGLGSIFYSKYKRRVLERTLSNKLKNLN